MKHVAVHHLVQFFKNSILQGSVATPFRCGGNFNDSFCGKFTPESISERVSKSSHSLSKV